MIGNATIYQLIKNPQKRKKAKKKKNCPTPSLLSAHHEKGLGCRIEYFF
jgi:hypothetical protein